MKTLFLVRHAKAETSREPELPDSERSLVKKGKQAAQKMARSLRKNSPAPQLIIASPAKRALKTAQILAAEFDYPAEAIILNETLYRQPEEGGEAALLAIIRAIDNQYNSVMVVGHDPLMSKFARSLQDNFTEKLSAGAIVEFEFSARTWKGVKAGAGELKSFDFPGRKKQLRKDRRSDLQAKIESAIRRAAGKAQPEIAETASDSIRKVSRKLARNLVKELQASKKAPQAGEETLPEMAAAPDMQAPAEKKTARRGGRKAALAPAEKKTARRARRKTSPSPAASKKIAKPRNAATRKRAAAPQTTAKPKRAAASKKATTPKKPAAPKKAASSKKATASKRPAAPQKAAAPKRAAASKRAASPKRSVTLKSAAKPKKAVQPKGTRRKRESKDSQ